MPRSSSKSAAPKYGRGRRIPDFMLERMVKYYNIHGWQRTQDKYRISSSTMQRVAKHKGVYKGNGERPLRPPARMPHTTYLLAKKLEQMLIEHRKSGAPPSNFEVFAYLLLRAILK